MESHWGQQRATTQPWNGPVEPEPTCGPGRAEKWEQVDETSQTQAYRLPKANHCNKWPRSRGS